FNSSKKDIVRIEATRSNPDDIVDTIISEVIQRRVSRNITPRVNALNKEEFRALLNIFLQIAELNKQYALGASVRSKLDKLFPQIRALAVKVPQWDTLIYLTGDIAVSIENYEEALLFYEEIVQYVSDDGIKHTLQRRVKELTSAVQDKRQ